MLSSIRRERKVRTIKGKVETRLGQYFGWIRAEARDNRRNRLPGADADHRLPGAVCRRSSACTA